MAKRSSVRKFHVGRALDSTAGLNEALHELTAEEIIRCLDLEAASQRRRSFITTLARRLARLKRQELIQQLAEKYDAPYIVEDSEQR